MSSHREELKQFNAATGFSLKKYILPSGQASWRFLVTSDPGTAKNFEDIYLILNGRGVSKGSCERFEAENEIFTLVG